MDELNKPELPETYWRACIRGMYDAIGLNVYGQGWYDKDRIFHKRTEEQDGYNRAQHDVMEKTFAYMKRCLEPTSEFIIQVELIASGHCFWGGENDDQLVFLCSDMFAWGCADGEEITDAELREVYALWKADPDWGLDKWVLKKRNEQPQAPVKKRMIECGAWNEELEALPENYADKACLKNNPDCQVHRPVSA